MTEQPCERSFIGDGVEATLAVAWYPLAIVGYLLGAFESPLFYPVVIVVVAVDWLLLRRRVASRLQPRPEDRRMLWLWTSHLGLRMGIRYSAGRDCASTMPCSDCRSPASPLLPAAAITQ